MWREGAHCLAGADIIIPFEFSWQFWGWGAQSSSLERRPSVVEGLLMSVYYFFLRKMAVWKELWWEPQKNWMTTQLGTLTRSKMWMVHHSGRTYERGSWWAMVRSLRSAEGLVRKQIWAWRQGEASSQRLILFGWVPGWAWEWKCRWVHRWAVLGARTSLTGLQSLLWRQAEP